MPDAREIVESPNPDADRPPLSIDPSGGLHERDGYCEMMGCEPYSGRTV